jgi:hypothetical protein
VSSQWIHDSTQEQSRWEKRHLSYGYLWWIIDQEQQVCAAMGDGGNVIYFNAAQKLVIAISSLFMQNAKDRIGLIQKHIEAMIG